MAGVIGALLLGICITLVVICHLRQKGVTASGETPVDTNPDGNTGTNLSPLKVLDEGPIPTAPDLVPPRPPQRMLSPQANLPSIPQGMNDPAYMKVYEPHLGAPIQAYSYDYVRNVEEVMKNLWAAQGLNTGNMGQALPLTPMLNQDASTNP